jgi:hypothetical protein
MACANGKSGDVVERLIANGAHVQAQTVNGMPCTGKPIHMLSRNQQMPPKEQLRSFRALVSNGADPEAPSLLEKKTPLALALAANNDIGVQYLVVEAGVKYDEELTNCSPAAESLLEKATSMKNAGLSAVPEPDDREDVKAPRSETVPLAEYSGDGQIRSEECRLNSETFELTSQGEYSSNLFLQSKASKAALCLKGEMLQSDGDYEWLPFWAMPNPSKRASRRVDLLSTFKATVTYALGCDEEAEKHIQVVSTLQNKTALYSHLGWDDENAAEESECHVTLETLNPQNARELDRSDRIILLKQLFGSNPIICAKFKDAIVFPVFIGSVDNESGGVYGCLSTRVDT